MTTFEDFMMDGVKEIKMDLKETKASVNDLCSRMAVIETEYKGHLVAELKAAESKWRKYAIIFGIIGSGSAITTILAKVTGF